jgi:hypothetical protein
MQLIFKEGPIEIWLVSGEYYVFGVTKDPRIAHSEDAAFSIAAAA